MKNKFFIFSVIVMGFGLLGAFAWYRWQVSQYIPGGENSLANLDQKTLTEGMALVDTSPCARRIFDVQRASSCHEKWKQFRDGLKECRDQHITTPDASFYYEEEVESVVNCFDQQNETEKSLAILNEAKGWGEWKIDHGPTICMGENLVKAAIEIRQKNSKRCLKKEEISNFISRAVESTNWSQFLIEAQQSPLLTMAGEWETDTQCVEPRDGLLKVIQIAAKDQGAWKVSQAPDKEEVYFVGEDPPNEFRLVFEFKEVNDCSGLSFVGFSIPY